jgi:prolyl oligopeptidase
VTVREFDLTTKSFVDGGFNLPEGKQNTEWLDPDTLIMTRDWGRRVRRPTAATAWSSRP